jgi:predicted O-linked N-acetylglucosamine transferase (SPINDLY family)
MTVHVPFPLLALPDDAPWIAERLVRPEGFAGIAPAERPRLDRAIAALPLVTLLDLAAAAGAVDAEALYRGWLAAHGDTPEAFGPWFNLGVLLMAGKRPAEAEAAYAAALRAKPDLHEATVNLGLALEAQGRADAALAAWRRALPPAPTRALLHTHLGRLLEEQGRLAEAAEEMRAALLIDPHQPDVQQHYLHLRQRLAHWPVADPALPGLPAEVLADNCGPLGALALHDDPARQTAINARWIARKLPPAPARLAPVEGYRGHRRIRLGYLSTDFCRHAMSFLIAEVLERHDRSRFEVHGYCASPEDGSDLRARVLAAFDRHVRIAAMSDEAAARAIRADEVDILIDLNGLTRGARLGVLRWKPAPVQASYLGYVGPVPLPELDWLIADAVTIPPETADAYAPRPLLLDGCYQANDGQPMALPPVSRAAEGLPEEAFVFCCFSHHYKITPEIFAAWTEIVSRAPNSVLWLVADGAASEASLRAHWLAAGLATERLIFAPRVDPAHYRARMTLGDLFLDTTPYNAGTVASDALRMGLPLVTLPGRAFAARMAASLLAAVGMLEGIASSRDDYVARAVAIARDPARHARLKARLAGDAWSRTLGDAAGFTRRLEAALVRIHRGE